MRAIEHEDVDKDPSSSPTPSPGLKRSGTKRSSPRSSHKKDANQRDRMQFATQQVFVHTQSYSSFTFPPPDHRKPAHTLGERDVALEREREREAGEFAKDQVLAHRERDRRHARRTEQRAMLGGELIEPFKVSLGAPSMVCHHRSVSSIGGWMAVVLNALRLLPSSYCIRRVFNLSPRVTSDITIGDLSLVFMPRSRVPLLTSICLGRRNVQAYRRYSLLPSLHTTLARREVAGVVVVAASTHPDAGAA